MTTLRNGKRIPSLTDKNVRTVVTDTWPFSMVQILVIDNETGSHKYDRDFNLKPKPWAKPAPEWVDVCYAWANEGDAARKQICEYLTLRGITLCEG